jgi:branched-chain amino acid transport system substrate-binding protein
MPVPDLSRRQLLGLLGAGVGSVALSACGGGSLGGGSASSGSAGGSGGAKGGSIKVGLIIPQAGVYTPLGVDMQNGWKLWLDQHGGKLGNYTVTTVAADEGEGPQTGVPAIQKLLQSDQVDVVVGLVNSSTALGVVNAFREAKKLLLLTNAGAVEITGASRSPYVWRTSFTNAQNSAAMGEYLAKKGIGPVYLMAPNYAAGTDNVKAFTAAYEKGGGKLAGQALTPFGTTQDFQPFLSGARSSGAKAVFCFYSGGEAVTFVKQYDQFGLKSSVPLYGSGFLTEGSVLKGQGASALGVQTTLHYSTELDNPANKSFVDAYSKAFGSLPTCFAMQTYDAGNVLARALAKASDLGGDSLSKVLGDLGTIEDSPRGPWTFSNQNPKQTVYLREVKDKSGTSVNAVVDKLGVYDQPGA